MSATDKNWWSTFSGTAHRWAAQSQVFLHMYDHSRSVRLELNTRKAYQWLEKWTFRWVSPRGLQNLWCPWSRVVFVFAQELGSRALRKPAGITHYSFIMKLLIYLRMIYSWWQALSGFNIYFVQNSSLIDLKTFYISYKISNAWEDKKIRLRSGK